MGRDTHFIAIDHVATMIGENIELLEEIAANSDNIDYGELVYVTTGPNDGMKAFTSRGIERLQEFLADIRSWQGGIRQFLIDQDCEPDVIERICATEPG